MPNESDEAKRRLFLGTAARHAVFAGNTYLIHFLKFPILQFRQLTLANDLAAFLCCFPNYFLLAVPALSSVVNREPAAVKQSSEIPKADVEEYLKDQSIEEILEEISAGERARTQQDQAAFHRWHQWYRQDNRWVSQALDYTSYGMLAATLAYMIVKKRKPF